MCVCGGGVVAHTSNCTCFSKIWKGLDSKKSCSAIVYKILSYDVMIKITQEMVTL